MAAHTTRENPQGKDREGKATGTQPKRKRVMKGEGNDRGKDEGKRRIGWG